MIGLPHVPKTWWLGTLVDQHTCNREYRVNMTRSSWLGKKLYSTIRENPKIKLIDIVDKTRELIDIGLGRLMLILLMDPLRKDIKGYMTNVIKGYMTNVIS